LAFCNTILVGIICNGRLPKDSFAVHEGLEGLTTILTPVVRPYPLDLFTKLSLDLKIELHEGVDRFSLGG
jgi:hypothetical protein